MPQAGLRLRYLVDRARRINVANVIEFARQSKGTSRAWLPAIIVDMLWSSVRYEMGFRDYAVWDIRRLRGAERATWMTHPKAFRLNKTLNAPESKALLEDKAQFYRDFSDVIGREWIDADSASDDQLRAFLAGRDRVLTKLAAGEGGSGITMVDTSEIDDVVAWREQLRESGQTLVEEVLEQDPAMAALYPGSVNTVRMITYLDRSDRLHVIAAVLRIGNGNVIDNFAGGGMFTMLDDEGVALYPGVDKNSNVYPVHPATGTPIPGFRVPYYDDIVAMLETLSRRLPQVPYVGWDIALTPDGPAVIEANHNSSVFQMKPTVSGVRTGLLERYRDAIGPDVPEAFRR